MSMTFSSFFYLGIDWSSILDSLIDWFISDGIKLIIGFISLIIIFKIINKIAKSIKRKLEELNKNKTIIMIVDNLVKKGLKILIFLLFLNYIGIDSASIGTIIASLGVAIGLALQGSLSNAAGGLVILVMRLYNIGDYIEAQGESGTVEDIKLFYTYLNTVDNKIVILPNGVLANNTIVNHSVKDIRRLDIKIRISYESNIKDIKRIFDEYVETKDLILKKPVSSLKVISYEDSFIELSLRVWVKNDNYWDMYFEILEDLNKIYNEYDIKIPYRQLNINIK